MLGPNRTPPRRPDDLDYELPAASVAQMPRPDRAGSRLLVDHGSRVEHCRVHDLLRLLGPGDVMVLNDSRVLPARLRLRRASGATVEVLLLEEHDDGSGAGSGDGSGAGNDAGSWEALVRPARRLRDGELLECSAPVEAGSDAAAARLVVEIASDLGEGRRIVRLAAGDRPVLEALEAVGMAPLPPYIKVPLSDAERYQTVFARRPGSAAAATAGLHLTDSLLQGLRARGVVITRVDLAIGLDTFRPVSAQFLDDHVMHSERYLVPETTVEALQRASRVVAVGTTVVRALETWASCGSTEGRTDLFIRRPFDWQVVDLLMTNFHLPRSTLLCLVDAFVGPRWRELYEIALAAGYRFLSFGDAMLLSRSFLPGSPGSPGALPSTGSPEALFPGALSPGSPGARSPGSLL